MTPAARLQSVIELAAEVEASSIPADALAENFFRRRRYAGSGDRRAIMEAFFSLVRRRARLDWWALRHGLVPTPRIRAIASAVVDQGSAMLPQGGEYGPAPLSPSEIALAEDLAANGIDHAEMPDTVAMECPSWLEQPFRRVFGDRLGQALQSLNLPAPVDLRVNLLRTSRDGAARALNKEGFDVRPTPFSPIGLRLDRPRRLGGSRALRDGLIEIQDEGSQILALLTDARPGQTVVDFCAGGGGKTLALAAAMENRGRLVACDIDPRRLARMDLRLARAGANLAEKLDVAELAGSWMTQNASTFDRVLLDVPCSGTGTWRRAPEARWRLDSDRLDELRQTQRRILDGASRLVRPGGRLIYATCSLLAEENEDQVEAFLNSNPEFSPFDFGRLWENVVGRGVPSPGPGPWLRLFPHIQGCDGFFLAILERK